MLLNISEQSAETLQEQIIGQVRARILTGDFEADHALPSIRSLAKSLRVSVITVQRAYEQLLREGLIYSRRGMGFYVAAIQQSDKSALAARRFREQLRDLLKNAKRDGLSKSELEQLFAQCIGEGEDNGNT